MTLSFFSPPAAQDSHVVFISILVIDQPPHCCLDLDSGMPPLCLTPVHRICPPAHLTRVTSHQSRDQTDSHARDRMQKELGARPHLGPCSLVWSGSSCTRAREPVLARLNHDHQHLARVNGDKLIWVIKTKRCLHRKPPRETANFTN